MLEITRASAHAAGPEPVKIQLSNHARKMAKEKNKQTAFTDMYSEGRRCLADEEKGQNSQHNKEEIVSQK